MILESLLLSRDAQVVRVLRPTLEKLSVEMEVCRGARSGSEILTSEKFDAVIVDCDDLQGGLEVLQHLRKSPSNRSSIVFAVLNGQTTTQRAFEMGANFVLQKPITTLNAMRCFSAGFGLMVRERRRYFRYPVELGVVVTLGQSRDVNVTTTNISEGGMAVLGKGRLPKSGTAKLSFMLPENRASIEAKAEIVWQDAAGRVGIRFLEMSKSCRQQFDTWLEEETVRLEPALDAKTRLPH